MLPPSQPQIGRFCCLRRRVEDLPGRCRHVAMFAYSWPRLRSRLAPNRVKRSSGRLRRRPESGGRVRAVVVPEGDKDPEHDERDRGQTAHSLIFVTHGGRPPRSGGAKRSARSCRSRLTDERMRVSSAVTDTTSVSRCVLSQLGSSAKAGQEHHEPDRNSSNWARSLRPRRARSRGPGGTDLRGTASAVDAPGARRLATTPGSSDVSGSAWRLRWLCERYAGIGSVGWGVSDFCSARP